MQTNRQSQKWLGRLALLFFLVGLADVLVVCFVRKPFPWVVILPALLPLLACVFVIIPKIKAEKADSTSA